MAKLQHYLNPLHVFCRLRDLGVNPKRALLIAKHYEHVVYNLLYKEHNQ